MDIVMFVVMFVAGLYATWRYANKEYKNNSYRSKNSRQETFIGTCIVGLLVSIFAGIVWELVLGLIVVGAICYGLYRLVIKYLDKVESTL